MLPKLLDGIRYYQSNIFDRRQIHFRKLIHGQTPQGIFITCCDSRIDPELLTGADPGDLFIVRNAGNLVPPYGTSEGAVAGELELAVSALGVKHVIVCGHTRCAAVGGILFPKRVAEMPSLSRWLSHAESELLPSEFNLSEDNGEPAPPAAVERHVVAQLENLKTHPVVAQALQAGNLQLHGWVYHLETGEVTVYDPEHNRFQSAEQAYAHLVEQNGALAGT